ncbi:MAG: type I restriction enzyme HsdR N-terminal domain-containing protein, partial [Bacteroidaceae bacterium]|nr:type I restriction enzyme HsdR N-terminal domain-containing protein [Bacteroidaceae bacterium]
FASLIVTKIIKMWQLNLPVYKFNTKKAGDNLLIFDSLRKKFVKLTPEEWVRQNFIQFLILEKNFPAALIAIETQILINGMKKRCDAVIYDNYMNPYIIIEFKSPSVPITQVVFDQVAVYNFKLNVSYFILSNGHQHFFCKINCDKTGYEIENNIPNFKSLLS